jgi:hypothetical protein
LAAVSDMWSSLWRAQRSTATSPAAGEVAEMFLPVAVPELRQVAASFGLQTWQRGGWHPRCFGFLSDPALAGLAQLFLLAEAMGVSPTAWQKVLIRLIPKPGSTDTRPIGLFPAIHRIWAKTRVPHIQNWQNAAEHGTVCNMGWGGTTYTRCGLARTGTQPGPIAKHQGVGNFVVPQ